MKIVQSFWTLPSISKAGVQTRENGGWMSKKYHYLGLALSCLLLRRFYNNVELITDIAGKDLLISKLKLPYTSVICELDVLNNYPPTLWSLPKLYSYSLQREPFLHVDGDVFIWRAFSQDICKREIVAQSPELKHSPVYESCLDHINQMSLQLPSALTDLPSKNIHSLNAGVLGGNDVKFLNSYALSAINVINENVAILKHDDSSGVFNIIIEQLYLYNMCMKDKKTINYIIPVLSEDLSEVADFSRVPFQKVFVHLMGDCKMQQKFCEQVEFRLRYEFPDYYYSMIDKINEISNSHVDETISKAMNTKNFTFFKRTKALLDKISDSSIIINKVNIKKFAKRFVKKEYQRYINDVYTLDKEIKKVVLSKSNWTSIRWEYICKLYNIMNFSSADAIMMLPLKLAPGQYIVSTSWTLNELNFLYKNEEIRIQNPNETNFILVSKLGLNIFEKQLEYMSLLLVYFCDSVISGNELVSIMQKSTNSNNIYLQEKVLSFILFELVYSGRLILHDEAS